MSTIGLLDRVKIDEAQRISDGMGLFVVKKEGAMIRSLQVLLY